MKAPISVLTFAALLLPVAAMTQGIQYGLTAPGVDRPQQQLTNPAILSDLTSPIFSLDLLYDQEQELQQSRWQILLPGIGLGRDYLLEQDIQQYSLDSAVELGQLRLGAGLSWLTGDNKPEQWQTASRLGVLWRPSLHYSLGASGRWDGWQPEPSYQIDLGWRPFADQRLTLAVDYRFGDLQQQAPWGISGQSLLAGRWLLSGGWQADDSWRLGLSYQFSGVELGYAQVQQDQGYSLYSLALGGQPAFLQPPMSLSSRPVWYELELQAPVGHRPGAFWQPRASLWQLQQDLALVAKDPGIQGVIINTTNLSISQSMAWELAQSLRAVRDQGKEVVVYIERGGMASLQLIAVATQVYLDPQGSLQLPGFVSSGQYFADALELAGIGVTTLTVGDYKSATESMALNAMSDADREQRQAIINSQFQQLSQDLARGRELSAAQLLRLFERNLFLTPADLASTGLVDATVRWHALPEYLEEQLSLTPVRIGRQALLARHPQPQVWGPIPQVAVLYALDAVDLDSAMNTRELSSRLESLRNDDSIRAVVLRVDSPGGDILASDLLAEQVRLTAEVKPVLVSMTNVAASGGYWISMYADAIYSTPNTITGSIGVASSFLWDKGLSQKLQLNAEAVTIGSSADLQTSALFGLLPYRGLSEREQQQLQSMSQYYYDTFVEQAAQGRNISIEQMQTLAEGRVYSGREALALSLVDGEASLYQVVSEAKRLARIDQLPRVTVQHYFASQQTSGLDLLSLLGVEQPLWQTQASSYLQQMLAHNGQVRAQLSPLFYPY